eukprot:gnl/MRDRNA2_/MRDRNA2_104338_c0_seq1.p1 gnl/MRDRNA2_/MRDRNA2_104338_c0~~gnl/MRDRNA2_/MRDRNA2_104338_c0_seq1.p1  ORF type:complete len:419 (+),score=72.14 gnl/MRDRNA2_/MRDRNA2_104338_c0_seq1:106-1362(+)
MEKDNEPPGKRLKQDLTVCVCGCGNKAHFYMAFLAHCGFKVNVYAGFKDEATRLRDTLEASKDGITVLNRCGEEGEPSSYSGMPALVSKDACDVVPDADVIVVALPTGARRDVLTGLKPHLKNGSIIIVMPGQSGLDLLANEVLRDELASNRTTVAGVVPKPVNCKVKEWGKTVELTAFKDTYDIATLPARDGPRAAKTLSKLLDRPVQALSNFLAIDLHAANPNMHPPRLMTLFADHCTGKIYEENPLFFKCFDEASAEMCQRISDERVEIWNSIVRQYPHSGRMNEVPDLKANLIAAYGSQVKDNSSLQMVLSSISSFASVRSPMSKCEGGFLLNTNHRWFAEDIPEGLCLYKGIGDLVGAATPAIDESIVFFQNLLGKEYVKNGKLIGKDVPETKSPQAFGICTLSELVTLLVPA